MLRMYVVHYIYTKAGGGGGIQPSWCPLGRAHLFVQYTSVTHSHN